MRREGDHARIVIVRRRKRSSGYDHANSAWKIALADFMTAMLALFMVLWAMNLDASTKQAIEAYFQDPVGFKQAYSNGSSPIAVGSSPAQVQTVPIEVLMRAQMEAFQKVGERIRERLNSDEVLGKLGTQVEIVVTKEGLRIELVENGSGDTFFPLGSARMKPVTQKTLAIIAGELTTLKNPVVVEGHTDGAPFGSVGGYSNWDLSSDRAQAARRVLEANGVGYARIEEVRGYADKALRVKSNPFDPSNRRISVLLPLVLPKDRSVVEGGTPGEPIEIPSDAG